MAIETKGQSSFRCSFMLSFYKAELPIKALGASERERAFTVEIANILQKDQRYLLDQQLFAFGNLGRQVVNTDQQAELQPTKFSANSVEK